MSITTSDVLVPTVLVGRNVRAEMIRHGKKQASIAAGLGLSQAAVSHRLNGRTPWDVNELAAIAGLLGVPLATLLHGVEAPEAVSA